MYNQQFTLPTCVVHYTVISNIAGVSVTLYTLIFVLLVIFFAIKLVLTYRSRAYKKANYKKLIVLIIITLLLLVPGRIIYKNILTLIPNVEMCDLPN